MLTTIYKTGDIPHSEHPRPQMRRDGYICLNGKWDLAKVKANETAISFDEKILVPFSPETSSSGLCAGFVLGKDEKLVYHRTFTVNDEMASGSVLLHFDAVDQECEVYINDTHVAHHRGGFTAFCVDISYVIKSGKNKLTVEVTDTTERSCGARGKQSSHRGGIWYTAQSGIWQSVWLEYMPKDHIKTLRIKTDTTKKEVDIFSDFDGAQTVTVYDGEQKIIEQSFDQKQVTLSYDFRLWSPEHPMLYDVEITAGDDKIYSYFGVRSFSVGKDERGTPRLLLNGKPYFLNGVLDQGYWPEGLLTYPSDEAAIDELTMLKNMGFNFIRKHIKIEPLRWYYHCDRLGIIVWQDFVSGGGEYKFTHVAALPFLGFHHKDNDYKYFAREDADGRAEFIDSIDETVNQLYNCTCIGGWVIFNEGWGQFDSEMMTEKLRALDDTRVIDSVSGWHDQGKNITTLKSLHTYYTPLKVPKDPRPVVLSEFGGYSMKVDGHVFCEDKEFGYKKFRTQEDYVAALRKLYLKKLKPLIKKGLCAAVYTQVSDVEEEINGLITYDRRYIKIPVETMREINEEIMKEASKTP